MENYYVNFPSSMTPLVLITGFLGAGKTTLLRSLIPELRAAGLDPSLVLNDYQNARIDAELFRGVAADVRPISGSCVCCGSREELIEQLAQFSHREKSVMLIEANGTTDTPELVEHLTAHPALRGYTLPQSIAVVDAKRWQKRFWHNELERTQIRTATHLWLTRREEVKAERLRQVEVESQRIAPLARRITLADLVNELAVLEAEIRATPERGLTLSVTRPSRLMGNAVAHAHSHFASVELALPASVERGRLEFFLNTLPPEVMRAKGVARLWPAETFSIFQKVEQSNTVQFVELPEPPPDAKPLIILVGPNLDIPALSESLTATLAG